MGGFQEQEWWRATSFRDPRRWLRGLKYPQSQSQSQNKEGLRKVGSGRETQLLPNFLEEK